MWAWLGGSNQGDLNASMPLYGYSDGYTDDYGGGSESKMHVHLKSTIENLTEFFQVRQILLIKINNLLLLIILQKHIGSFFVLIF